MDHSLATRLFRQLFLRCTCRPSITRPSYQPQSLPSVAGRSSSRRLASSSSGPPAKSEGRKATIEQARNDNWSHRSELLPVDRTEQWYQYKMTNSEQLRLKTRRPKRTKMLMRDFIEDSLYNPGYGYFSKRAVIFNPGQPFDFNAMRDEAEFYRQLGERYTSFEDQLDEIDFNETRQLWHTPTELFRPHYAEAIALYMITNYKLTNFPFQDLIIYELGAGNGTFMLNVLDYIRDVDPEVYARTQYKIIEISTSLANLQSARRDSSRSHADKVEVINQSIFSWDTYISAPCFFLALEVVDNFAHDIIRYSPKTEAPLQGTVLIDESGEFDQFYNPVLDPVAARFFRVRDVACELPLTHPLHWSRWKRAVRRNLPFAPNLSEPEWIPTRLMQFFDVLQNYFPAHNLLVGDFHSLPTIVPGLNAPLVQTRFQRRTVPVTTPLVHQGYFDILFPTDFNVMESLYRAITGKFTRVLSHEDFMRGWADLRVTETRNGDNPLLSWYKNASFMVTI